jgi:hypothetical protein
MLISNVWRKAPSKKYVSLRRINRERMRIKLQRASFIPVPRLVKHAA